VSYRAPNQRAVTPQGRGRFPAFDVLDQAATWDDVTAGVVLARLGPPNDLGFFTVEERAIAGPLLDLLLAQNAEPRVPVLALIDTRLAISETDGWHYDDMPEDGHAWRDSVQFLDEDATSRYGCGFAVARAEQQANLIQTVQNLAADQARWHDWLASRVWSLWTRYACTAFYSHPWAWNEIGFGGPAYPRGYLNLGVAAREHWEVPDAAGVDPVPFAARAERARGEHHELLGADQSQQEIAGSSNGGSDTEKEPKT
jgi:hypothetical protein